MKCSIKLKTTHATRGPGSKSTKLIPYIKIMFLNEKKVFTEKKWEFYFIKNKKNQRHKVKPKSLFSDPIIPITLKKAKITRKTKNIVLEPFFTMNGRLEL